jgi:hypothetical protein
MSRTEHFDAGHNMPEHNTTPGRFRYKPNTYEHGGEEIPVDDELAVHVGNEKIGHIKRNIDTPDGWYGAWKGAGDYHETRRAASVAVCNKHIAKKNEDQADG